MDDSKRFDRAITDLHKLSQTRKFTAVIGVDNKAALDRALAELFKISECLIRKQLAAKIEAVK